MATGDPVLDFALGLRSDALTPVMKAISAANSEYAYIVLIPLIYWLFSRRAGIVLMVADALATFAAVFLKDTLMSARPPDAGETKWLTDADGYGFPSGHTTAAATTWATLAAYRRDLRLAAFGALVTAAVAFSRLYLGVHYTGDVLGAIAIGAVLGLAVLVAASPAAERFGKLPRPARYASVLIFPALLALNHSNDAIVIMMAAAGAGAGHLFADEQKWVLPTGDPRTLPLFGLLRLVVGMPVLGALALGLGSPSTSDPLAVAVRFAVLGLFVTAVGPRIFMALEPRFARKPEAETPVT